jgi:phosphoglycerate dehydrogenase-like enzyme
MRPEKILIWNDFNWDGVSRELRSSTLDRYQFVQGADNLKRATIAFGKPDPDALKDALNLRWIQLTSAGHAPYDGADIRAIFKERGITLTNSSAVYAEPCAEHLFAMMLALARCLPRAWDNQRGARAWDHERQREQSFLLQRQKVLLLGYGAIARRLAEMLAPFQMQIFALRRHPSKENKVTMIAKDQLSKVLSEADHIVNALPENDSTRHFVDVQFLDQAKPQARLYNIGRGNTVDQTALLSALRDGRLAAAYLDVTTPEPLPPDNPLWSAPNCYISPHSGGGHRDEYTRLLHHFLYNLKKFEKDGELPDRVA